MLDLEQARLTDEKDLKSTPRRIIIGEILSGAGYLSGKKNGMRPLTQQYLRGCTIRR